MLLKERRTFCVINDLREAILNSTFDIGVMINLQDKIFKEIKNKYSEEEINYALRWLKGVEYFGYYNGENTFDGYTLTSKGFNEWLFPLGKINTKSIFISYSTKDKSLAGLVKDKLIGLGYAVFFGTWWHKN